LLIHIASAGSWIRIDVVMAVLIFTAVFTTDDRTKALSDQALGLFVVWSLLIAGLVCLLRAIVMGLGTRYGLVRYWWVATRLVLNLAHRSRPDRVAWRGRREGRAREAVPGRRTGHARGRGGAAISTDRFPDSPAHRDGISGLQAVGSNSKMSRVLDLLRASMCCVRDQHRARNRGGGKYTHKKEGILDEQDLIDTNTSRPAGDEFRQLR
jgi:hypothetical protein